MNDSYSEHHQLERYRMLIEYYGAVSFEYNLNTDALGFDFWWHDGHQHIILVENFIRDLDNSRMIAPDSRKTVRNAFENASKGKAAFQFELQADILNKGKRWWRAHILSMTDGTDKVYSIVGMLQDIQEERDRQSMQNDLEDALRRRAETDDLTGLYNKVTAQDKIKELLTRQVPGMHSALLILDVDNFKHINDTMGHLFGDSFLREAAGVIKKCFREDDILGRFGGDEFVVFIAQHGDKRLVERKSRQILRGFNRITVESMEQVSCSIGAVIISSDMTDYDTAFKQADSALYESKRRGKNCFTLFSQNTSVLGMPKTEHTVMDAAQRLHHDRESLSSTVLGALLSSSSTDMAIFKVLEATVNSFRLSRAFICECGSRGEYCVTGDYVSPSVSPEDQARLTGFEHLERYTVSVPDHLEHGDFFYSRVSSAGPGESPCGVDGVKFYLACAIRDGSALFGFIVFEQLAADRSLSQEQVESLCFVSNLVGLYLQKQRTRESLPDYIAIDIKSVDQWAVPAALVFPGDMLITHVNRAGEAAFGCSAGDFCNGKLCPDGHGGDCERCALTAALNGIHGALHASRGRTISAETVRIGSKTLLAVFSPDKM